MILVILMGAGIDLATRIFIANSIDSCFRAFRRHFFPGFGGGDATIRLFVHCAAGRLAHNEIIMLVVPTVNVIVLHHISIEVNH